MLFPHFFLRSGDQDSVIPLTGSRTLVQNLAHDMGLKTTTPYRVWFEGQQVRGKTSWWVVTHLAANWWTLQHFVTECVMISIHRLEDGLRCMAAARYPSPPSGGPPTRRRSRSPGGRWCSSEPSCRASLCLKPSHDPWMRCFVCNAMPVPASARGFVL